MSRFLAIAALLSASLLAQPPAAQHQFMLRLQPIRADFTLQNMTGEEQKTLGRHAAHLQKLLAEDKITSGGQVLDPKGFWGFVIVNAPDLDAAVAIMNADPAVQEKVLRGEAFPFRALSPAPSK